MVQSNNDHLFYIEKTFLMIKYLKLSALNILVVTLVGSVIWTIMEYRSGSGINLFISGFIIVIIILISYLLKEIWPLYNELKK